MTDAERELLEAALRLDSDAFRSMWDDTRYAGPEQYHAFVEAWLTVKRERLDSEAPGWRDELTALRIQHKAASGRYYSFAGKLREAGIMVERLETEEEAKERKP